eukprot:GHVU01195112.1.p1 GENE.GHVU01195112.1~~GHVU01195112.1.p1  ORF type:complete len:338 (-),score=5.77 GHVU01195112.1:538-1551(-)
MCVWTRVTTRVGDIYVCARVRQHARVWVGVCTCASACVCVCAGLKATRESIEENFGVFGAAKFSRGLRGSPSAKGGVGRGEAVKGAEGRRVDGWGLLRHAMLRCVLLLLVCACAAAVELWNPHTRLGVLKSPAVRTAPASYSFNGFRSCLCGSHSRIAKCNVTLTLTDAYIYVCVFVYLCRFRVPDRPCTRAYACTLTAAWVVVRSSGSIRAYRSGPSLSPAYVCCACVTAAAFAGPRLPDDRRPHLRHLSRRHACGTSRLPRRRHSSQVPGGRGVVLIDVPHNRHRNGRSNGSSSASICSSGGTRLHTGSSGRMQAEGGSTGRGSGRGALRRTLRE